MNSTQKIIKFIEDEGINCENKTLIIHTDSRKEIDTQILFSSTSAKSIIFTMNYDSYKNAIKYEFPDEVIIISTKLLDHRIMKSIERKKMIHYTINTELIKFCRKSSGKVEGKEFKLLTDIIWGWDLGKPNWMITEDESEFITRTYQSNIFPLFSKRTAVTGEIIEVLTGYALMVPVNMTEKELIAKERSCSHYETWDSEGKLHYLSEVAIHKDYRRNGTSFIKIMKLVISYCKAEGIQEIYTTAVSKESRSILSNKRLKKAVRLLAEKEEKRLVYKINIDSISNM